MDSYKNDIKSLKEEYKQIMKDIKASVKQNKRDAKVSYKELRLEAQNRHKIPGFFGRIRNGYQRMILSLYEKAEERAASIRYKQTDPDGFEADDLLNDISKLVKKAEKKLDKGGSLDSKETGNLIGAKLAVESMIDQSLGRNKEKQQEMLKRISDIVPDNMVQEMIQSFCTAMPGMMD